MKYKTPYYAVIFSSMQTTTVEGYKEMSEKMESLAEQQDGFLGLESARNDIGITVSYWESLDAIKQWKAHSEHLFAQKKGREHWYNWYHVRICKVERDYAFQKEGE